MFVITFADLSQSGRLQWIISEITDTSPVTLQYFHSEKFSGSGFSKILEDGVTHNLIYPCDQADTFETILDWRKCRSLENTKPIFLLFNEPLNSY